MSQRVTRSAAAAANAVKDATVSDKENKAVAVLSDVGVDDAGNVRVGAKSKVKVRAEKLTNPELIC